ncbi:YciI family protein [Catellatospora sp. NPDC049111]|uniref:YciI family protein n=1 Tax=Catellatospora sp. NPDC049111 TaxID=3155271 RepID=UPI00340C7CA6
MELESFELVMLRRPANPPEYDDAESARIQAEHLAYLSGLRASGHVVTNGPVIEPADESLRGLVFFRTGSLDEARRLAEQDPAVRAGRLVADVMTWWCPPGTMAAPGKTITLPS